MDLRNIDLTGPSNDPAQEAQARCSVGKGIIKSPCISCQYHGHWDKDVCREFEDCPLGNINQSVSSMQHRPEPKPPKNKTKLVKCEFEGCQELCSGKSRYGKLCSKHRKLASLRACSGVPDEFLLRKTRPCIFPGCDKPAKTDYCKAHYDIVRARQAMGWPEERWHEVVDSRRCKLSKISIRNIRNSDLSLSKLAKKYGVAKSTIWTIKNGYKHDKS
jgi:hypothetical protein